MPGPDPNTNPTPATPGMDQQPAMPPPMPGGTTARPNVVYSPEVPQSTYAPNAQIAPENQNAGLPDEALRRQSIGARIYHGVLNALAGSQQVALTGYDENGKPIYSQERMGPGQQWKKIISGAITGAAAAGAAGPGPGSTMRGLGAGYQAGRAERIQQTEQEQKMSQQSFENEQKAATEKANRSLMATQMARATFDLGRSQVDASVADTERENQWRGLVAAGGKGSEEIGTFHDAGEAYEAFQKDKTLHPDHANGKLVVIPHIENGKVDGVRAARVTPGFMQTRITEDTPVSYERWDPKQKKMVTDTYTIPAQGATYGELFDLKHGLATESMVNHWKEEEADAKTKELKFEGERLGMETGKTAIEEQKMRAEIQQLNMVSSADMVNSNAQQIYEGSMDPANLNKRGKAYEPTLYALNQLSRAETGHDFDIAKASADYTEANRGNVRQTLNYLNSLTGPDNKSGNLGTLIAASDRIKRTQFPPINDVEAWARLRGGDAEMAGYVTDITEVADQVAKILQGGGSGGGTSDAKLKQAQDLFSKGFNGDQIRSVATELRTLLANRKEGMIGNNRYLTRWYGQNSAYAQQAAAGGGGAAGGAAGGAGGGNKPPLPGTGKNWNKAQWAAANPHADAEAAEIQARKQGYTVITK